MTPFERDLILLINKYATRTTSAELVDALERAAAKVKEEAE